MELYKANLECEARFEVIGDDKGPRESLSEWFPARLELYQAKHPPGLDGKDIIFGHGFVEIGISFEEAISIGNEYDFILQLAVGVRLPDGQSLDFRILNNALKYGGIQDHAAFAVASYTLLSRVISGV